jgi:hypothetical protein
MVMDFYQRSQDNLLEGRKMFSTNGPRSLDEIGLVSNHPITHLKIDHRLKDSLKCKTLRVSHRNKSLVSQSS